MNLELSTSPKQSRVTEEPMPEHGGYQLDPGSPRLSTI